MIEDERITAARWAWARILVLTVHRPMRPIVRWLSKRLGGSSDE